MSELLGMLTAKPPELKSVQREWQLAISWPTTPAQDLPLIELLRVVLGMLIGAEERVNKLVLARLADNEFSRGSSSEQAACKEDRYIIESFSEARGAFALLALTFVHNQH